MQVTAARRAGNTGATSPMTSTAASRAPTACTQPDPLEWATPAQASTATTLPTTGAEPGHRVRPGAETDATVRRAGIRRAPAARGQPPGEEGAGQCGHQPDGGSDHDDGGPEDGPDDDHAAHAGHQAGGGGADRAPQQRPAAGGRCRAHVGGRVSRR